MKKLIIIDGNAIIHRAYHAIPPLTTQKGQLINAVYGFTSMLLKVWKDLKPTHIAVTFDLAGPTFRHIKFDKYKATRIKADQELYDQIPLAHNLVQAFNIPIYEKKGYEADDCIGTIVEKIKTQKGIDVLIVTGDMDTLQLIEPNIKVYTLRKGLSDTVTYGAEEVRERFGFGPDMVVDYKALRGDASDNIPGVPGIGEKTASELIRKIGGIKEIYKQLKTKKIVEEGFKAGVLKKLEDGEDSAKMSYELASIDRHVPDLHFNLEDCALKDFDREKVVKIFQEFEFTSMLKRVPGMEEKQSEKKTNKAKEIPEQEIKDQEGIKQLITLIKKEKKFACKAILNGKDIFTGELSGLIFVVGQEGFYVAKDMVEYCWEIFNDKNLELSGHNLKILIRILKLKGIEIQNKLFDTMMASYLLNPGSRTYDPSAIVLRILGRELPAGIHQGSLFGLDVKALVQELYLISETVDKLRQELIKIDALGLLEKIEMPLLFVLAEMELNGMAVDVKMLEKLSKEAAEEIAKISGKIFKLTGREFNIASPVQLREILFDVLEIPMEGIKKGKTGLSTSAEQLEKMRGLHPIIEEIESYRELEKLRNTYTDVLPALINKKTGRIHTTFNQAVTATGRLSSSEPNLQNIPIRTELGREIRKAFIAEEGNVLVSADYSQIELRIVASLAEDKRMMEIFTKDEDIHRATAAAINGVPLDKVTTEMRRAAKEVNFGVLYGMGSYGLSWRADISQFQAREFIKKYFEQFSGVKNYIDRTLVMTKKDGYCETLFGRRRYINDLNSANFQLRSAAERMAINHPIQGTAADLIKMAMIKIYQEIIGDKDVKLILQVHDELVFEVKKDKVKQFGDVVKEKMETVVKLRVPIKVDVHAGKRWGEMK